MKKIGNAPHPSAHQHTHDVLGLFTCLLDDVMTPKIIFMILIKSRDVIVGWQSKQMELIDMLLWEWKCKVLNNINKEEYGSSMSEDARGDALNLLSYIGFINFVQISSYFFGVFEPLWLGRLFFIMHNTCCLNTKASVWQLTAVQR